MNSRNPPATWSFKSSSNQSNLTPIMWSYVVAAAEATSRLSVRRHSIYFQILLPRNFNTVGNTCNLKLLTTSKLTVFNQTSNCRPPGQVCVGFHQWYLLNQSCITRSGLSMFKIIKDSISPGACITSKKIPRLRFQAFAAFLMFPGSLCPGHICLGGGHARFDCKNSPGCPLTSWVPGLDQSPHSPAATTHASLSECLGKEKKIFLQISPLESALKNDVKIQHCWRQVSQTSFTFASVWKWACFSKMAWETFFAHCLESGQRH